MMRRRPHGRAVGTLALERHLHGAERLLREVRAREDGDDARSLARRGGVDAANPRVGVDRAHDHRVRLPGHVHVVVEPAAAAQQPAVLEPLDALADAELTHVSGPP
jgi:hypothetical protein